jgi:hypothetical protein
MSDQPKEPVQKKRAPRISAPPAAPMLPDGGNHSAATAALALAVASARKEAAEQAPPAKASIQVEPSAPAKLVSMKSRASAMTRSALPYAAVALMAVAAGWSGARSLTSAEASAQPWTEAVSQLHRSQEDVVRLTGDVKTLKVAVEALKESVDRSRADTIQNRAEFKERFDRSERAPQDVAARLVGLGEQLDRLEASGKDPAIKLAAVSERLDRMERQIATVLTPAVKPTPVAAMAEMPAQTGSIEKVPETAAKDMPVEGWILHEVYDGVALLEGRNRRLIEVGPGETVPGVGRVEAIERRGKRWVVVTSKGLIGPVR